MTRFQTDFERKVRDSVRRVMALPGILVGLVSKPKQRGAVVYLVNGRWVVGATVSTFDGLRLHRDPEVIALPVTPAAIEQAIARALANSQRYVRHPRGEEWKTSFKPFLDAAGVRSRRAFMKDARHVSLNEADEYIEIMPSDNLGAKEGFHGRTVDSVVVRAGDMSGVAQAVMRFLSDSDSADTGEGTHSRK